MIRKVETPSGVKNGIDLLRKGDTTGASAQFDSAIRQDPKDGSIYIAIANACTELRQWAMAAQYSQKGIAALPRTDKDNLIPLYTTAGVAYSHTGQMQQSLDAHKAALDLDPRNPLLMNNLGYTYAEMPEGGQNLDEALRLTKRAVDLARESGVDDEVMATFQDSLAWVLYKKGSYDEAMATLERAVELAPNVPDIHYHLAMAYIKKNRPDDATIELQKTLRLDPNNERAAEELRTLQSAPGAHPAATPAVPGVL